jgi:hypothetical protein
MSKHHKTKRRPPRSLPAKPDSEWLRTGAVADWYNISKRTVLRKVGRGELDPPEYPLGPDLPMWRRRTLIDHDNSQIV